jgi:hypothetical protein
MAAGEEGMQVIFRRKKFFGVVFSAACLVVNSGPPTPGPLLHQSRSSMY